MNREEQHDDKMLYELLRCIKALTTTEIGKTALRLHYPNPFPRPLIPPLFGKETR